MYKGTSRIVAGVMMACLLASGAASSGAELPQMTIRAGSEGLLRVGHDAVVIPSFRRFVAVVTAVGPPDKDGRIHSFRVAQIGREGLKAVTAGQMRGWRVTILAGQLFASHFEVRSNTETEITVNPQSGALNGLAERDVLIVEDVAAGPLSPEPDGRRGQGT